MANTQTKGKKVTIKLFKGAGAYDDDVQVIVNGKVFLIKRGEEVEVPEYVAEILKQQAKQLTLASEIS